MGIDWVTVAAQIVNFLILVWLLKRFLYGPVISAIAARETEIATRLAEAEQAKIDANDRKVAYLEKTGDLERQEGAYLAKAQENARRARQELERKARQEVDALEAEWRKRLEDEHAGYLAELRDRAAFSIINLTRKALADLADERLETQIERQFEHQIEVLAPDLAEAVRVSDGDALVGIISTSFPLSEKRRTSLSRKLSETTGRDLTIEFEEDTSGSPGIALKVAGLRVGWTIDTYVDALEADIAAHLKKTPTEKYVEK
jgi:F-type H+-transporting ATPase subunit b